MFLSRNHDWSSKQPINSFVYMATKAFHSCENLLAQLDSIMTTFGKDPTDATIDTPKDMYVKLISSDDHEFYVKRDLALTSQTIKAMLSGPGRYSMSKKDRENLFLVFFKDNMQRMKRMSFIFEVLVHR